MKGNTTKMKTNLWVEGMGSTSNKLPNNESLITFSRDLINEIHDIISFPEQEECRTISNYKNLNRKGA